MVFKNGQNFLVSANNFCRETIKLWISWHHTSHRFPRTWHHTIFSIMRYSVIWPSSEGSDLFFWSRLCWSCPYHWAHDVTLRIPPWYSLLSNCVCTGWLCLKELVTVKAFFMFSHSEFTLWTPVVPRVAVH